MKYIAVLAIFFLVGCAHQDKHDFTPPSAIAVQTSVAKVREHLKPEGKAAFADLKKNLADYQKKVEEQTKRLVKAENDAAYWHEKQIKALKELWMWRGICLLVVACVVGYIGIRTAWKFAL